MSRSSDWLSRYRAGHHNQVWEELRQLGSAAQEPSLAPQARLVSDEMARRARHNVEVIVERLADQGYRFHSNDDEQTPVTPHHLPGPQAQGVADWLVGRFGSVPMTLLSWMRIVGDVWLVGTHPQWSESASADPLVIEAEGSRYRGESIQLYFEETFDDWREASGKAPDKGTFVLPLAPDRLHKENVSGGPPYGIVLPDGCVDGLFVMDEKTMPFVSYLNWVFRNGGFPWPTGSRDQWRVKQALAKDLLPL